MRLGAVILLDGLREVPVVWGELWKAGLWMGF